MSASKRRTNRRQIAFRAAGLAAFLAFLIGPQLQRQVYSWVIAEQSAQAAGFDYPTPLDVVPVLSQIAEYGNFPFNCFAPVVAFFVIYGLILGMFSIREKIGALFHPRENPGTEFGSVSTTVSSIALPEERLRADFVAITPTSLVADDAYFIPAWKLSPREFEYEIARIIERTTGKTAQVVGGAGDDGVDIRVTDGRSLVGIVQCKRYFPDKALPPQHIRELAAVKAKYGVKVAYLVTSTYFSSQSRAEAYSYGIRLMDGNELEALRKREYAIELERVRHEAQLRPNQTTYLH